MRPRAKFCRIIMSLKSHSYKLFLLRIKTQPFEMEATWKIAGSVMLTLVEIIDHQGAQHLARTSILKVTWKKNDANFAV